MELSRSTYYYKPKDKLEKKKHDADIADSIEKIAYDFPYYGYRRVTAALKRQGLIVNHKKVSKIIKKYGYTMQEKERICIYH